MPATAACSIQPGAGARTTSSAGEHHRSRRLRCPSPSAVAELAGRPRSPRAAAAHFLMHEADGLASTHTNTAGGHHRLDPAKKKSGPPVVEPAARPRADAETADHSAKSMVAKTSARSYEDLSALFRFAEELATTSTSLPEFLEAAPCTRLRRRWSAGHGGLPARFAAPGTGTTLDLVYPTDPAGPYRTRMGQDAARPPPYDGIESERLQERGSAHDHRGLLREASRPRIRSTAYSGGQRLRLPRSSSSSRTSWACLTRHAARRRNPGYQLRGRARSLIRRRRRDFLGDRLRTTNLLQEQRQVQQRALRELEIAVRHPAHPSFPANFPDNCRITRHLRCVDQPRAAGRRRLLRRAGPARAATASCIVIADVMGKGVPGRAARDDPSHRHPRPAAKWRRNAGQASCSPRREPADRSPISRPSRHVHHGAGGIFSLP